MNKKQLNRLNELTRKIDSNLGCSEDRHEIHELEFLRNKQNINFRLPTDEKYYYAWQCYIFEENIKKFGHYNTPMDEIENKGAWDGLIFNQ